MYYDPEPLQAAAVTRAACKILMKKCTVTTLYVITILFVLGVFLGNDRVGGVQHED